MKNFCVKESASNESITGPIDVWEKLKEIGKADQESMWIIGTNGDNKEIFRECVAIGGLEHVALDPRIVFKRLLVNNCTAFILIHNHISDTPEPSEDDIKLTHHIQLLGYLLDIHLTDHIIITRDSMGSLNELGLFLTNDQILKGLEGLKNI